MQIPGPTIWLNRSREDSEICIFKRHLTILTQVVQRSCLRDNEAIQEWINVGRCYYSISLDSETYRSWKDKPEHRNFGSHLLTKACILFYSF